jgi:phosphoglycolate phosphatase-like HAD superfamily hydrolase
MSAPLSLSHSDKHKRRQPKQFAPLSPDVPHGHDLPELQGIIFDMDGTLCLPQNYMFKEMRAALDIPRSVDILDHVRSLSNVPDNAHVSVDEQLSPESKPHSALKTSEPPSAQLMSPSSDADPPPAGSSSPQSRAVAAIQAIERRAMTSQRPQPGLQRLMAYLQRQGVRKALCTRNFPAPVHHLLDSFLKGDEFGSFEPIITRDSDCAPKPSPEGLWRIAEHWGLHLGVSPPAKSSGAHSGEVLDPLELAREHIGAGLIMVGDSIDDMAAGYRAGAATVLLANDENEHLMSHEYTGRTIRRLDELIDLLDKGFSEKF